MIYTATNGMTWDYIAYQAGLSEFMMDDIMSDNAYFYSDYVTFDGGEEIEVTTNPVITNSTIKAPWE